MHSPYKQQRRLATQVSGTYAENSFLDRYLYGRYNPYMVTVHKSIVRVMGLISHGVIVQELTGIIETDLVFQDIPIHRH